MDSDSETAARRALIIIPGTVNYFYNLSGHRIAEALRELGFAVDVNTLNDCSEDDYDWCLLSNITEIVHAYGDEAGGLARIGAIRRSLPCHGQPFDRLRVDSVVSPHPRPERPRRRGVDPRPGPARPERVPRAGGAANYRFVLSGLTPSEGRRLDALGEDDSERTIPWSFVGHATPRRAALVDHLIQSVDPRGFVYMPEAAPYTEKGSPHLNQEQFERVLDRTRYQVWCSHHSYFYMEPERFRSSLLTGGVPVKLVDSRRDVPKTAPLTYLMIEPRHCGERLTASAFSRLRRRFWQDWRRFPTLGQEIARVLHGAGIDTEARSSRAA